MKRINQATQLWEYRVGDAIDGVFWMMTRFLKQIILSIDTNF
jgi:hypothetical protein